MLNAKAMTKTFQNSMSPGVENIFLVNKTGALVLSANNHDSVKILGAIISNIWSDYDSCMSNSDFGEGLRSMIVEGENGVLVTESVSSMYLCVQGGNDIGRLLEILKKLKEAVEAPLQEIVSS